MTSHRIHGPDIHYLSAASVSALFATACAPAVPVDGTIQSPDGGPVAGAVVELRCPDGSSPTGSTTSDNAGAFALPPFIGCASVECGIVVRKPTGEEARFSVGSHCRGRKLGCGRAWCNTVQVEAKF